MEVGGINLTSPAQLAALFAAHGFRPRKRLGQHFLVDGNVLRKVVKAARLAPEDQVLEIGAGAGTLTLELAERAKRVVAVEVDERLAPILKEVLAGREQAELVIGDALALELGQWLGEGRWKVAANLPYYITSPLLARLLAWRANLDRLVLMVQEEVAARLLAPPGGKDYSSLSIFAQTYCECSQVTKVSRNCFYPRPEVDSAVLALEVRGRPLVSERLAPLFFKLVRAAFGRRRKMLRNALASLDELPTDRLAELLRRARIAPERRGETLTPEEFAQLASVWADLLGGSEP